jgi:hypothetical protein
MRRISTRKIDLALRDPLFRDHVSDNKEYLSEGDWPNDVGPKAARSNIGVINGH